MAINPKSLKNLKKIPKGKSGNPKGRPKLPDLKEVMAKCLSEEKDKVSAADKIVAKMKQLAKHGNIKAAEFLFNRGYGLPTQDIKMNGDFKQTIIPITGMEIISTPPKDKK